MLKGAKRQYRRRGAVIVLVAVMSIVLLGFVALAVDIGYICANTAAAQNAADAGALAGAAALRAGKWQLAQDWALDCIKRNPTMQGPWSVGDQTIELGRWDLAKRQFTVLTGSKERNANACRVTVRENNLRLFFGGFVHKPSTRVCRQAIATGSPDCNGIWSFQDTTITGGGTTGSYDSTYSTYDPLATGSDGDVCSCQNIHLSGGATINGDAEHGDTYGVTQAGGATVTGSTLTLPELPLKPVINMTTAQNNNDNFKIGKTSSGKSPFPKGWNLVAVL